ncbi:MAG: ABC transporter substrate-binding protein [Dehalococcoidia bacterium]|nr:ABC transporter substrate-binding protein [Dehalococcoidia bacterium]MDW8119104.1 ABC transporter substrate-binding protein [Chloroflexota bacterium]
MAVGRLCAFGLVMVLLGFATACRAAPAPTGPTPTPTSVVRPAPQPTPTPFPTPTPLPLATPGAGVLPTPTPIPTPTPGVEGKYGGILIWAQERDVVSAEISMYEGLSYLSQHPTRPLYSQIVMNDPQDAYKVIPDLAERWEMRPDGMQWTFYLRRNAVWHDGKPVTAHDVKFTFDRMFNPPPGQVRGRAAPVLDYMDGPASVVVKDDYTVQFNLKFPAASFLALMNNPYLVVMPKHYVEARPDKQVRVWKDVIGSGAFRVKSMTPGSSYEMVKFDKFYIPGRPYLDGMRVLVMPDPATRFAALRARRLHIIPQSVTYAQAEVIAKEMPHIVLQRVPRIAGDTIQLNVKQPPFTDPRVRRAVSLALPRACLKDGPCYAVEPDGYMGGVLFPYGPWALRPEDLADKVPGYASTVAGKERERQEARRLLAEAGFPNGFKIVMDTRELRSYIDCAQWAIEELRKVGIEVTDLKIHDSASYYELTLEGRHKIIAHGHAFALDDPDLVIPDHYLCGGAENHPKLCMKEIEDLFAKQQRTLDVGERIRLLKDLQRLILDQDAKIWIAWEVSRVPHWPEVKGWYAVNSLYMSQHFWDVWLER